MQAVWTKRQSIFVFIQLWIQLRWEKENFLLPKKIALIQLLKSVGRFFFVFLVYYIKDIYVDPNLMHMLYVIQSTFSSHIGYNIHARYWLELDSCIAPALQKCVEFRCKNYEEIHHWNDTIFRQQRCHLRHMDYIVKQLVDIIIFLLTLAMVTSHSPNKPDTTIYSLDC